MISVGNTLLSDDVVESYFICDLKNCKGACCVEGELGAPLEMDELKELEKIYDQVEPYLSSEGKKAIKDQGTYIFDYEGEYSTPTIGGKECAYSVYDEKGVLKCGIEKAYLDGKTSFRKPISCHLYPLRVTAYENYDAINYHRWHICDPGCSLGSQLNIPLYKFLKEPLIRKYGKEWYDELEKEIESVTG